LKPSPLPPRNRPLFFRGEELHRISLDIQMTLFKKKVENIGVLRVKMSI
jgi:hypothetical protein